MSAPRRRRRRILHRLDVLRRKVLIGPFAVEVNYSMQMDEVALDVLEDRLAGLEELVAARWPRSMFLRRRLARRLRASSATFAWAGETFAARRGEAMTEDIDVRMTPRRRRTR